MEEIVKARMQEGKRVSPSVPYGYRRDPDDKQKLIIDEEPAAVVRCMFHLVLDGSGVNAIADIRKQAGFLTPEETKKKKYASKKAYMVS